MRSCGILLHISSLPSRYGIGTLGKEAYSFVDFLVKAGQEYWQILPIGPTGYGDSPYQCFSAFAGNPLLISIETLIDEGLIRTSDVELSDLQNSVRSQGTDFTTLFRSKIVLLKLAYERFFVDGESKSFEEFKAKNAAWLDDYALFMSLKYHFDQKCWFEWEDEIRLRRRTAIAHYTKQLSKSIDFWKYLQFKFFEQWGKLKQYTKKNGIRIIGDIPIYVSPDSSDVWASPEKFMLDKDRRMLMVAGCPPDAFSPTGQLWGNPLYKWKAMEKDGFDWWVERIRYSAELYDIVRIDHFRGFESFYAIHAEDSTAENGMWLKGPGMKLFDAVRDKLGKVNIIAEDLGFLTDEVRQMLRSSGFPGMNVLEFAFDNNKESNYMPHNYIEKSVSYIGTHDNDTALGWYKNLDAYTKNFVKDYFRLNIFEGYSWGLIRGLYASVSQLVIIQMQDVLALGSEARMNTPSTIGGNWSWRMHYGELTDKLAARLAKLSMTYFRSSGAPEDAG